MRIGFVLSVCLFAAVACGSDDKREETTVFFDLSGSADDAAETFFDFPFPADLRLVEGAPNLDAYPNPSNIVLLDDLFPLAEDRQGFSTMLASYFRFSAPLAPRVETDTIAPSTDSPILLIDVDPDSAERGRLIPTVARTLAEDSYVPANVLAIAPRPGFVLRGNTTYAVVVTKELLDAEGEELGVAPELEALAKGEVPEGALGQDAADSYQLLWETLDQLGIERERVAAANVYSTGDVVAELADLSDKVRGEYSLDLGTLTVDPDDGADHERFCELTGTVSFPQFQTGTAPFLSGGVFVIGDDGVPELQGAEDSNFVITIPKGEMPEGGYPLMMYFHGSGGLHSQVVDRGKVTSVGGEPTKGEGPAHVLAPHGFATVGSGHPVNPERVPGASDIEYINFNNLSAFRDLFRQGAIEQRLLLDALLALEIAPEELGACTGITLPDGETAFRFQEEQVVALGQSMGGMYTNIIGAVEPRIGAVVPTGAGGMWHYFILETELVEDAKGFLTVIFRTDYDEFTFLHPTMQLLGLAWEGAEPMVYMPRLAEDPLPGHPARPIYQPAGEGDSFFPTTIYDAAAIAYGNRQAGSEVWGTMQDVLALDEREGFDGYPVNGNLAARNGEQYTGVVVQYEGDGIYDPHAIYGQLDEVKYQYGCFLETFVTTGEAVVLDPQPLGTPCQ